MKKIKYIRDERPAQIQLELPDYSYAYEEWKRKQNSEITSTNNTVIIIDNY